MDEDVVNAGRDCDSALGWSYLLLDPGLTSLSHLGPIASSGERLSIIYHLLPQYDGQTPACDPHSTAARNIRKPPPAPGAPSSGISLYHRCARLSLSTHRPLVFLHGIIIVGWIKSWILTYHDTVSAPRHHADPGTRSRCIFTPHYHNQQYRIPVYPCRVGFPDVL